MSLMLLGLIFKVCIRYFWCSKYWQLASN